MLAAAHEVRRRVRTVAANPQGERKKRSVADQLENSRRVDLVLDVSREEEIGADTPAVELSRFEPDDGRVDLSLRVGLELLVESLREDLLHVGDEPPQLVILLAIPRDERRLSRGEIRYPLGTLLGTR